MTRPSRLQPDNSGREIAPFTSADLTTSPGSEPTVLDVTLAERLGFRRPRDIRTLIDRNRDEIEAFGPLRRGTAKSTGGRPASEFYLTRQQAMLVTVLSKTSIAARVRKQMIEVFDAATSSPVGILTDRDEPLRRGELVGLVSAVGKLLEGLRDLHSDLERREDRLIRWENAGAKSVEPAAAERVAPEAVDAFLTATVTSDRNGRVAARTLYRCWIDFATRNRLTFIGEKTFAALMADRLGASRRSVVDGRDVNAYHGVRLYDRVAVLAFYSGEA